MNMVFKCIVHMHNIAELKACWLYWSLQSKKTFLMSTPKCLGDQILSFTWVKLTIDPPSKLPEHRENALLFNVINESPFETVN